MSYGTVAMKIPILFLFSCVFLETNGDVSYVPKIMDSVSSCDDFENKFMNCDGLKLGSEKGDDGENSAKLSGTIVTSEDITDTIDIEIDVWKILDLADEYMYNTRVNFCSSMQDSDAPWIPLLETLNISGCPVPVNVFEVQPFTVSLGSMEDVLCHDFCGEYLIHLSLMDATEKLSCHVIQMSIVEVDVQDE